MFVGRIYVLIHPCQGDLRLYSLEVTKGNLCLLDITLQCQSGHHHP